MSTKKAVFTLALIVALSVLAGAQATASLRGEVKDPKGAMVVGAEITIHNPAIGYTRSDKTEQDGTYQFVQIPPGTYTVTVASAGFATIKNEGVQLLVNTPATLNFDLRVATGTETIEVRGIAPLVNTSDASLGKAFSSDQIQSLPFEGREAEGILSLQPGVLYLGRNLDERDDSRSGAVAGARSDQNNYTVDGIDNNDQLLGLAFTGVLRTPLDALQEFRVTTSQANAEAGRSSGAQVTMVTKSGTNNWHGALYEYYRPPFATANDWFVKHAQEQAGEPNVAPKFLRNTFGASIGGPIKKDKLFLFAAYEGMRKRENQIVNRTIPSTNLRQGIVSYECSDDTSTTDGNPVCPPGGVQTIDLANAATALLMEDTDGNLIADCQEGLVNTCPLGPGANPAVLTLWNSLYVDADGNPLVENTDVVGDGYNFRGYTFNAPNPVKEDTYVLKLDYSHSDKHRFFVRGNLINDHVAFAPQLPGLAPNSVITFNNKGIAAGWTAMLSEHLVNNFRYGFIRQGFGDSGANNTHFVNFRGVDEPISTDRSSHAIVPVHNFVNDTTWTKGKHTVQFGTNLRFITNNRQADRSNYFSYTTNSSWLVPTGMAGRGNQLDPGAFGFPTVNSGFRNSYNFPVMSLAGIISQYNSLYNQDRTGAVLPEGSLVQRKFKSLESEFYVQDSWRIKPNFTITLGLRYSLLQPPYEANGEQVAPTVSMADWFGQRWAAMLRGESFGPNITMDLSGKANGGKPYWDWDYKNFAPRIAFAWSPGFEGGVLGGLFGGPGRTSIRGGWGLYYDHFGQGIVNTFDRQGSFGLTTEIINPSGSQTLACAPRLTDPSDYFNPPSVDCDGNDLISAPPGAFPVTPPGGYDNGSFAIYWGLNDKLKTPMSQAFNLSITREISRNFVFEASYTGRLGQRLMQELDLAMPLNVVDQASGMDYFTAATMLSQMAVADTPITDVAPIPFWENLWSPAAGPNLLWGDDVNIPCSPPGTYAAGDPLTATQNMYDAYYCNLHDETTALLVADVFCYPGGSTIPGADTTSCAPFGNVYALFDDQFSSLYAWSSIGRSYYHGAQFSLRHRMAHGIQFDFNYTWSKSIDIGSNSERISAYENNNGNAAYNSQILNSWNPYQMKSVSDFDTTHQINANYVVELPFGKGRALGSDMRGIAEAIFGGWQASGLFRWTSGLPFSVNSGSVWATNWEFGSNAVLTGNMPQTGAFVDADGEPNVFADRDAAIGEFREAFPGESGQRNLLRGPGFFNIDFGLTKTWSLTERAKLKFAWEVFNVTNSVRFDAASIGPTLDAGANFGRFNTTLSLPRVMQFGLRFEF